MGILKRAADLTFTFRFIRMLVMDWKNWDAYKQGIIDENGKRKRETKLDTDEKKSSYTPFIRMAANIKRLLANVPGGSSKLGTFASALFLVKEKFNIDDKCIQKICKEHNIEPLTFVNENNSWFLLDDKQLAPGIYRVKDYKVVNTTCEEIVRSKDQIRVKDDAYPIGDVFGIDVYEAIHVRTNQPLFVTINEIYK